MAIDPISLSIITGLASNAIYSGIQLAANKLSRKISDEEKQELESVYQQAFENSLGPVFQNITDVDLRRHTGEILQEFLADELISQSLIVIALDGKLPEIDEMESWFESSEYDIDSLPITPNDFIRDLVLELAVELGDAAGRDGSKLTNLVTIAMLRQIIGTIRRHELNVGQSEISTKIDQIDRRLSEIVKLGDNTSLDDSQKQKLISEYRKSILKDTEFASLNGIPLPINRSGQRLAPSIPLDRIYIRIQAIEQHQKFQVEHKETRAIKNEVIRRSYAGVNTSSTSGLSSSDPLTITLVLGEHFYRQGEVYNFLERMEPVDPVVAIGQHEYVAVLGAPGSGKSSLLRYVSRNVASNDDQYVPICVSLRDFSTALAENRELSLREFSLDQVCKGNSSLRSVLVEIINKGHVIWLLDALDEAHTLKESVVAQIRTLSGKVVVTSRPNGYISLAGFEHYEILPLSIDDVQAFIRNWYTILGEQSGWKANEVTERIDRLLGFIEATVQIKAVVRNPLILTFLAVSAHDDSQYTLPSHRAYLYRSFITELLNNWEIHKDQEENNQDAFRIAHLSGEAAQNITLSGIKALGWHLHEAYFGLNRGRIPSREALVAYLTDLWSEKYKDQTKRVSEDVIDFWERAGLIDIWTIDNEKYLAFRHMTFQEFVVAEKLVEDWLESPERTWDYIHRHQHHYAWREPIALFGGLLDVQQLNEFLSKLIGATKPISISTENEYGSPIEAIQSAAQNEIRLAIMLIAESSRKINSDLLNSIAVLLQGLLRSQFPILSIALAEEAARVRSNDASTTFTDMLINDVRQGKWEHSPYRDNLPSSTAALLKEAQDGLLSEARVEAIMRLAEELKENYWQIAIAAYYQNPNQKIAEFFVRFIDENYQEGRYGVDDTLVRIAHYLLVNGYSTSKAISILVHQINMDLSFSNVLTKKSVTAFGEGLRRRQLSVEEALRAVEAIVRIQLVYDGGLPQESLDAFHAALAPQQNPEVVEIVTKRLLGVINNDERPPIHHQDGEQILARVVTDFEVSRVVYSVFEAALDEPHEEFCYSASIILQRLLEHGKITIDLFPLYLRALNSGGIKQAETMIRLLSKAVIENKLSDDMLKQLSPFWTKALNRDLWARTDGEYINNIIGAHIYLIETGFFRFELSREGISVPGIYNEDINWQLVYPFETEYRKRLWYFLEHFSSSGVLPNTQRKILQEFKRISDSEIYYKTNALSILTSAIRSGKGIPESIPLFEEHITHDYPAIRISSIDGLASAIKQKQISSDKVALITALLDDEDDEVSAAAKEAIEYLLDTPKVTVKTEVEEKNDPGNVFVKLQTVSGYDVVRLLRELNAIMPYSGHLEPGQIEYLIKLLTNSINEYEQAEQDMRTLAGQEHEQAKRTSIRAFDQVMYTIAILSTIVKNGYRNRQVISILVQAIQNIHLPDKLDQQVWESVSKSGYASDFVEDICAYHQQRGYSAHYDEKDDMAFVALGVACQTRQAMLKALPTLIETVKDGNWPALLHIAEIVGENRVTDDAIVEAALDRLRDDPERQELALIIGRVAEYRADTIPQEILEELHSLMENVPLGDRRDYLKGFGYVIRNPSCSIEIMAPLTGILLDYYAKNIDGSFDDVGIICMNALTQAQLIDEADLSLLAYLIRTQPDKETDKWTETASRLSANIMSSSSSRSHRLIECLYYSLVSDSQVFYPNFREHVAYFIGFVDTYESRNSLIQAVKLYDQGRSFYKGALGAINGLAYLGRLHPEWQEHIIDTFMQIAKDDRGLLHATIHALQIMQTTSKEAESLLVTSLSDSEPHIQAAAADVLSKLGYTNEIILEKLAQGLSDPHLLVRNAAWQSLDHLLRQGHIYDAQ